VPVHHPVPYADLDRLLACGAAQNRAAADDGPAGRVFVSDWNGEHPFLASFLGDFASRPVRALGPLNHYARLEEDPTLEAEIRALHADAYGEDLGDAVRFVPGAGAAGFLTTMLWRARGLGFDRLCYLPPVYNNAIYLIRELGFAVHAVAGHVGFGPEPGELDLPGERSALWLTDPLWFAGRRVPAAVIEEVRRWQRATGSVVFVDGTFQYGQWEHGRREWSSALDPALTYRLVCPTKALAVHGFRFAYLQVPAHDHATTGELHARLHGAGGVVDRAFAHRALHALGRGAGNRALIGYAALQYRRLCEAGAVLDPVPPDCSYFAFAEPLAPPGTLRGMGPDCFGVRGRPRHVRVNLLSPTAVDHLLAHAPGSRRSAVLDPRSA
jgi:hypothetical protein